MAEEIIYKRNNWYLALLAICLVVFFLVKGEIIFTKLPSGDTRMEPDNLACLYLGSLAGMVICGIVYLISYKKTKIVGKKYKEEIIDKSETKWVEVK